MKNKKLTMIIIILILLILVLLGTFFYLKDKSEKKELMKEIEEQEKIDREEQREYKKQKEEETEEKEEKVVENKCEGTINATFKGKYDNNYYKEEITIILNNNGTYEKSITEGEYQKGTYTIANGNVIFEFIPSGAPPSAKSKYSYKISEDCSKITIKNSNFSYLAYKN